MKVLNMQFSPTSCRPFSLGPNILFSASFSDTPVCSSLEERGKVSHAFKKQEDCGFVHFNTISDS
jgi:hypothetical protein